MTTTTTTTKTTAETVQHLLAEGYDAESIAQDLDLDYDVEADAVLLPGWWADDGNHEVEYPLADSGEEAASDYVDEGDWDLGAATSWVGVWAWRVGWTRDESGTIEEVQVERERHSIALDPEEPECAKGREHDWRQPHFIVGGMESNPGVHGHGGGVVTTQVCMVCGCERTTDSWAQDPETGEEGLTSTAYETGKYLDDLDTHVAESAGVDKSSIRQDDDGDWCFSYPISGDDEANEEIMDDLRRDLGEGWEADWTGGANGFGDDQTADIYVRWAPWPT